MLRSSQTGALTLQNISFNSALFRAFAPFATFGATKVVQKRLFTPSNKKREAYFQPISGTYSVKLNPSIICKSAGFFVPIQVKSPVSTFFSIVILFFVTLTFTKSPCSKPYFFTYSGDTRSRFPVISVHCLFKND